MSDDMNKLVQDASLEQIKTFTDMKSTDEVVEIMIDNDFSYENTKKVYESMSINSESIDMSKLNKAEGISLMKEQIQLCKNSLIDIDKVLKRGDNLRKIYSENDQIRASCDFLKQEKIKITRTLAMYENVMRIVDNVENYKNIE